MHGQQNIKIPVMCCFHAFACKALRADIQRVKSILCPVVIPSHSYYNFMCNQLAPTTLARCLRSAYNQRIPSLRSCFSFPRSIVDYIISSPKFLYPPRHSNCCQRVMDDTHTTLTKRKMLLLQITLLLPSLHNHYIRCVDGRLKGRNELGGLHIDEKILLKCFIFMILVVIGVLWCSPCDWADRCLYVGETCFSIFVLGTIKILTSDSSEMLVFICQTKGVTSGDTVILILK